MKNILPIDEITRINDLCEKYDIKNHIINSDGSISVPNTVDLAYHSLTELPLRFKFVDGDFNCSSNSLTTITGSPIKVTGNYDCSNNNLTTIIGSPLEVTGEFVCAHNNITSLEGCPEIIGEGLYCNANKISSLDYATFTEAHDYTGNDLPEELMKFFYDGEHEDEVDAARTENIRLFFKYYKEFDVWNPEFDVAAFNDLIADIKEGLE